MLFSKLKIVRLASGGIITNYFCTSTCRHCLYNCSPRWEKNYISVEAAEENFRTVKSHGCSAVHIGGGEPLLRPEALGALLDAARRAGVSICAFRIRAAVWKRLSARDPWPLLDPQVRPVHGDPIFSGPRRL